MNPKTTRYYTYVKPFLKNKVVRTYSSVIFTLLTISIFAVYAIRPTVLTIISLQKSIVEQQALAEKLKIKVNSLSLGKSNYERIDPDTKNKLINLIPIAPNLPRVLYSLSQMAEQNQATLSGIQFQPIDLDPINPVPNKNAVLSELDITFSFQGRYSQHVVILNELKKLDRLIEIQSVTMNRQEANSILMTITGKAKFLK